MLNSSFFFFSFFLIFLKEVGALPGIEIGAGFDQKMFVPMAYSIVRDGISNKQCCTDIKSRSCYDLWQMFTSGSEWQVGAQGDAFDTEGACTFSLRTCFLDYHSVLFH